MRRQPRFVVRRELGIVILSWWWVEHIITSFVYLSLTHMRGYTRQLNPVSDLNPVKAVRGGKSVQTPTAPEINNQDTKQDHTSNSNTNESLHHCIRPLILTIRFPGFAVMFAQLIRTTAQLTFGPARNTLWHMVERVKLAVVELKVTDGVEVIHVADVTSLCIASLPVFLWVP